jgi:hypothetical protein
MAISAAPPFSHHRMGKEGSEGDEGLVVEDEGVEVGRRHPVVLIQQEDDAVHGYGGTRSVVPEMAPETARLGWGGERPRLCTFTVTGFAPGYVASGTAQLPVGHVGDGLQPTLGSGVPECHAGPGGVEAVGQGLPNPGLWCLCKC